MRLSLLPVSYFPSIISGEKSIGEFAREAASLELDAIDISVLFIRNSTINELKSFRRQVEHENISIFEATTYPDFTHPDRDVRDNQLINFCEDLKRLSELGVDTVRVTAGQSHPNIQRENGITWALSSIGKAVAISDSLGINLVFENHSKPGVWDYHDFSFPTDIFLEMAEALRNTSVKIQFDTANPVVFGDEPMSLLPKVINETTVIHVADTSIRGQLVPTVIGDGIVPLKSIFTFLKENDYTGFFSIEEASNTGFSGIEKAVNYTKNLWKSI